MRWKKTGPDQWYTRGVNSRGVPWYCKLDLVYRGSVQIRIFNDNTGQLMFDDHGMKHRTVKSAKQAIRNAARSKG